MRLSLSQALGPSEMGQTCRDSPSETRHWISGSCPTYFLIYQIFIYYDDDGLDGMVRSPCLDRTSQARPTLTNDSRSTVRNHARRTQHTVPYAKRAMDDAFIAIHRSCVRNISESQASLSQRGALTHIVSIFIAVNAVKNPKLRLGIRCMRGKGGEGVTHGLR